MILLPNNVLLFSLIFPKILELRKMFHSWRFQFPTSIWRGNMVKKNSKKCWKSLEKVLFWRALRSRNSWMAHPEVFVMSNFHSLAKFGRKIYVELDFFKVSKEGNLDNPQKFCYYVSPFPFKCFSLSFHFSLCEIVAKLQVMHHIAFKCYTDNKYST